MRNTPTSQQVSRQMSRMPVAGSDPELALRRELHRRGLRYRVNLRGLPGTPDVAFTRARLAVFVDGCFWHACPDHATLPKNNRAWWRAKFEATRERDARKTRELEMLGWQVVHVWEHDDPRKAADEIYRLWRRRVDRAVSAPN
ncbi:MAG: very short patch repair endonuclease [Acidimicrobiales bacterium]|nr:very short patch repair endonuclease [Acidimicrobiales bacterium]